MAAVLAPRAPRFAPPAPEVLAVRLKRLFAGAGQDWLVVRTDCGYSDGCCLLLARALRDILPGSRVVTMLSRRGILIPDHYGVLWRGWYFDGSGGYPSARAWLEYFVSGNFIPLPIVQDRYVFSSSIPSQSEHRDDLVAFLEEGLLSQSLKLRKA